MYISLFLWFCSPYIYPVLTCHHLSSLLLFLSLFFLHSFPHSFLLSISGFIIFPFFDLLWFSLRYISSVNLPSSLLFLLPFLTHFFSHSFPPKFLFSISGFITCFFDFLHLPSPLFFSPHPVLFLFSFPRPHSIPFLPAIYPVFLTPFLWFFFSTLFISPPVLPTSSSQPIVLLFLISSQPTLPSLLLCLILSTRLHLSFPLVNTPGN